jgi:hypothetical protein
VTGQLTNGRWAAVSGLSEMIFLTEKATSKERLPSFMQNSSDLIRQKTTRDLRQIAPQATCRGGGAQWVDPGSSRHFYYFIALVILSATIQKAPDRTQIEDVTLNLK